MKRVLIIEDDFFVAGIYEQTYKQAGCEVAIAYDGEAGLRRLGEFRPDVVQLDLMVPKMNGVEVIRQIRANPDWKSLPVLVLSSCCDLTLVREWMTIAFADETTYEIVLPKPYVPPLCPWVLASPTLRTKSTQS